MQERPKYILLALYSVFAWSSLSILTDFLRHVPVFFSLSVAFLTSSLLSVYKFRSWSRHPATILTGFVGIFGFHALFFFALHSSPPIEATLLVDLWPLVLILFTPVFLPQLKLRRQHYVAMFLGLSGSVLIVTNGRIDFDPRYLPGYTMALIAGLVWAGYTLMTKVLPDFKTSTIGFFCLLAAVASFAVHLIAEPPASPDAVELVWMIFLGIGPLGTAFYTWDRALKLGDTRVIGALSFLIPLLSTVWLILFGGHELTPITGIAMAVVLAGSIIGSMPPKKIKKNRVL